MCTPLLSQVSRHLYIGQVAILAVICSLLLRHLSLTGTLLPLIHRTAERDCLKSLARSRTGSAQPPKRDTEAPF
jgi:hypothetical protein